MIFWLFGPGNFKAVMLSQILIDLGTCLLVADLTRRMVSERAARIAFVLAALCPFLANYAAAELTETLEIFFTAGFCWRPSRSIWQHWRGNIANA